MAGDLNDFEFSAPLATLTQGGMLDEPLERRPAGPAYSYKFNGHLQTLDHILVTAGLNSRRQDMRYVHFDNDVYERMRPTRRRYGPLRPRPAARDVRWPAASTSTPGNVTGIVPATLALTLGTPAPLGRSSPASRGVHGRRPRPSPPPAWTPR